MEMKNIKIGVIADDFTGAGDAASFLEKSGAETIMYNAVPNELQHVCDAAVIALKTRSVTPHEAVAEAKKAVDFLKENGCDVVSFVRYAVGEGIEKRQDNFAEEVMSQAFGK